MELLKTGFAEKRETRPRVALLDNFENVDNSTAHGEMTESVLLNYGKLDDADVQRYHCGSGNVVSAEQILKAPAGQIGGLLKAYVENAGALLLKATTADLRQILAEQPTVKVISQSQSQSPVRVAQPFFEAAKKDPAFCQRLGQALGLPGGTGARDVSDELVARSEKFLRDGQAVKDARKDYLETDRKLSENGVIHLIAAGNLGDLATQLDAEGHQLSPSAFRSILVSDFTTVVGSLDESGQLASFTSPRSNVEILAPGVNIPFSDPTPGPGQTPNEVLYGNGTSLSVPLVAGQVSQLLIQHPQWNSFEVKAHYQGLQASRLSNGQEAPVALLDGSQQTLKADGQVDDFVLKAIGSGFLSGLQDESVPQFVQSEKSFRLVLPGESADVCQVVDCRDNGEGQRKFTLETSFGSHRHVVRGEYSGGAWNPQRTVEEFYCDPHPQP